MSKTKNGKEISEVFNKNNKLTEKIVSGDEKTKHIKYNSNGGVIQKSVKDDSGETIKQYNDDGRILNKVVKDKDGKVSENIDYSYNKGGKLQKKVVKDGDGKVIKTVDYSNYNKSGNRRTATTTFADGTTKKVRQKLDGDGKIKKRTIYRSKTNDDGSKTKERITKDVDGMLLGRHITDISKNGKETMADQIIMDGQNAFMMGDKDFPYEKYNSGKGKTPTSGGKIRVPKEGGMITEDGKKILLEDIQNSQKVDGKKNTADNGTDDEVVHIKFPNGTSFNVS